MISARKICSNEEVCRACPEIFQRLQEGKITLAVINEKACGERKFCCPGPPEISFKEAAEKLRAGDDVDAIQRYLFHHEVNDVDSVGATMFMQAAAYGRTGAVKALLNAGADVNHQDNAGLSALIVAAVYGRTKVAELLV